MRYPLISTAALAVSALALTACDGDEAKAPAAARTAQVPAASCVPVKPCAPAAAPVRIAPVKTAASGRGARYAGNAHSRSYGGARGYARVEHYGAGYRSERYSRSETYEGGYAGGQLREDAYASGATMSGRRVYVESGSSSSSSRQSWSSGYAGQSGYAAGGYAYSSQGGAYASGSRGYHEGKVVIRGRGGDSWTWRSAGRDERGYLVWPGKTPQ